MCQPMTGCVWKHATSWTTESDIFKKVCLGTVFHEGLMTALFVTLYTVLWIQGATAVMGTPAVTSSSDINIMAQQQQSNHHGRHLCFEYFSRFITSVLFTGDSCFC